MRSEIAQQMTFGQIRYSAVWEDWRLLQQGLDIQPDDHVLSIASAGDNVLALLLLEPEHITAIDLNDAQTALLELKLAAIKSLDHEAFVTLLGVRQGADRWNLYQQCRQAMPEQAVAFWDANRAVIEQGATLSGRLEQYIHGFGKTVLPDIHPPEVVDRLFRFDDLREQAEFFDKTFATPKLVEAFKTHFGRENMERHGRDPAQFQHVKEGDVGAFFYERFRYACTQIPLAGNYYVEFFLTAHYRNLEQAPQYLRPGQFARLRRLVERVNVVTDELERFVLDQPDGCFSKANFSDVFEYMSESLAGQLLAACAARFRPRGRLCYWNLLVPRSRPESLKDKLEPNRPLADQLWKQDRSWFYRAFHVEVVKP